MRTFDVVNTFSHDNYRNGVNWNNACISPDSQYVCAGGSDGKLFIWDATTGKLASSLKPTGNGSVIEAAAWGGSSIASCDKSGIVTVWT
jgi:autophagy-related protein 16